MKIIVNVIDGPAADRSFAVEMGSRCIVGRSEHADFRITNDPLISREHFSIAFDGSVIALTDLGSTNGTFVDGVALTKDQAVALSDGQTFIAGRTTNMVVQLIRLPQPSPPNSPSHPNHPDQPNQLPPPLSSPPVQSPPASPAHSPFYDSTEFNIKADATPGQPKIASPPVSHNPQPAPPSQPPQPADSGADGGNFSQSIVSDYQREPRLGNASDFGPSDQNSLLFNNFSPNTSGSGELFTSGISDDGGSNRSDTPSPLPPIDPVTAGQRPVAPHSPPPRSPQATPPPSSPPSDQPYHGSIAPPGMGAGGSPQFAPLAPTPTPPAVSPPAVSPPAASPPAASPPAASPPAASPPAASPPNALGTSDAVFSPDQPTPVHPHSPLGEIVSNSVGMPDQIHQPVPQPDAPQPDANQNSIDTLVPPSDLPFETAEGENGVFFYSGSSVDDLPAIIESFQNSYESLFIVDLPRAGFEPDPPESSPSPTSESENAKVDAGENESVAETEKPASLEIQAPDSTSNVTGKSEIESESSFVESAHEPAHQSPFDDVEDDDALGSPFEHAAPASESKALVGTPLYHWLPTSAQRNGPIMLTADEFAGEDFGIELAELWKSDAVVCLFGSSAKQLADHSQHLVRMDLRTGKSGKSMFGFCWPSVLETTLESQPAKTVDRIFAGGVAAILLEDPQAEFAWRIASKLDLTDALKAALKKA